MTAAFPTNPADLLDAIDAEFARRQAEQDLARRCKTSLRTFVEQAWPMVEPATKFIPNWHIDAICEHLQAVTDGKIKKLLINIGPGHAKSLIVSVLWPSWVWSRDLDELPGGPIWRALFCSYSEDLVLRDAARERTLLESPWYRAVVQPKWTFSPRQDLKGFFENTEKGFRVGLTVNGQGTGHRGDCIVVDDPLNAKNQHSTAVLEACIFWWDQVMSSRLNDLVNGSKVIIMQRLSDKDLSAHVIAQGGYEHLCLPTEYEPDRKCRTSIGWSDPRTKEKELLFPQLFGDGAVALAKRDLGTAGFAGQHQQRPSPAGGGMLKSHWWNYWQPKGMKMPAVAVKMPDGSTQHKTPIDLPVDFDAIIQTWDMAFKDHDDSDYVVGQVHAALAADRFILDQERGQYGLPETLNAVRRLSIRWPNAQTKLVEDKANGPAVVQSLKAEIGGFIEVNPDGTKVGRAAAASPMLESGNWYLPHPAIAEWVADFIGECAAFPKGSNDDCVDSWSQGAKRLIGVKPKPPKREPLKTNPW